MGTNYYADQEADCPTCTRTHICQLHLGKSSFGWKFLFAWNGGEFYKSVDEMKEWLKGRTIRDEYDEIVPYDEFWEMVDKKMSEKYDHIKPYEPNSPGPYPHNPLDHGVIVDGTYFLDGEFS